MRMLRRGLEKPCSCVFRAVFRACYSRFREYENASEQPGAVSLESNQGQTGYRVYSLKHQEYVADFCLAARRALDDQQYRLFRYVFLLGADSAACARHLGMDRGQFYHEIYRIEEILGKYLAELEPYPLFPIDEYMGGSIRSPRFSVSSEMEKPQRRRVRLRMIA
jgi:hypothetical protein